MTFTGLVGLFFIGKSSRNGFDYTSDLLDGFLFLWRLSLAPLVLVSLSTPIFCYVSSFVHIVIPMLLLLVSSRSCSCLVVVQPFNKLG